MTIVWLSLARRYRWDEGETGPSVVLYQLEEYWASAIRRPVPDSTFHPARFFMRVGTVGLAVFILGCIYQRHRQAKTETIRSPTAADQVTKGFAGQQPPTGTAGKNLEIFRGRLYVNALITDAVGQ